MKRFRSVLFWCHLAAGVSGAVVILVMSFTGAVLALKPQIQNWVDHDVRFVTASTAPRLGARELLEAVTRARPDVVPQSMTIDRDPDAAATVGLGPDGSLYVNPYTGAVLGAPSARTSRFFQSMTSWHRYMGATGEYRATGRSATGASNLAFLLLGISGLYLWWPKGLTVQCLRPIVWFRRTSTARARDFNWHNTIGFWCLPAIIVMTLSGVVMSYQWGNNLVYRLTASAVPAARRPGPGGLGEPGAGRPQGNGPRRPEAVAPAALDAIVARAKRQVPTWSQLSVRLPNRDSAPVSVTISDGAQWNQFARSQLTLDSASGEVVQWQPYEAQSSGQKMRGWLRFAHTGELGGIAGQLVAGIGCVGGVMLVWTGLSLAFRRVWNWSWWARLAASRRPGRQATGSDDDGGSVRSATAV